jgi:hypothetical protein
MGGNNLFSVSHSELPFQQIQFQLPVLVEHLTADDMLMSGVRGYDGVQVNMNLLATKQMYIIKI